MDRDLEKEIKGLHRKFSESLYKDFHNIQDELLTVYEHIEQTISDGYDGLLYSNAKKELLKSLSDEEIFIMNMPDKAILGILNIIIYNSVINQDYDSLTASMPVYSRLRFLNRMHLEGPKEWSAIVSFVNSDKELFDACYLKEVVLDDKDTDKSFLLIRNLLRAIFFPRKEWTDKVLRQCKNNFLSVSSKFDRELIHLLRSILSRNEEAIQLHFENVLGLYPRSQWLVKGFYGEANLSNKFSVFLAGLYKLILKEGLGNITIVTHNIIMRNYIQYANHRNNHIGMPEYRFSGKLEFINEIIGTGFTDFVNSYQDKLQTWSDSENI